MPSRRALVSLVLVVCGVFACGSDAMPGAVDGAVSDATAPFEPVAPASPMRPTFGPCPEGWRDTGDGACDPWPVSGHATCANGEAHFPGEPGCVLIGPACATDGFPTDLPTGAVVLYVQAGAPAGGDGTRAAPFARIADAIRVAPAGSVVAVSRGTYDEGVVLRGGVSLWGACAAETIVRGDPTALSIVRVLGVGSEIRNVTLTGSQPGISTLPGTMATFHLENVIVGGVVNGGIVVAEPSTGTAHTLVVRDVSGTIPTAGRGVTVLEGSRFELRRGVIERVAAIGVFASGAGASLLLEDVAVLDSTPTTTTGLGRGIVAQDGPVVEAHRVVVERSNGAGVLGSGAGSMLVADDLVVRDMEAPVESTALATKAIGLQTGVLAMLSRVLIERSVQLGVAIDQATVSLEDVIVRDVTGPPSEGDEGDGILAQHATTLTLHRVLVERVHRVALRVSDPGTSAMVTDATISDAGDATSAHGRGVHIESGAVVRAERIEVSRFGEVAFIVSYEGTRLDATDIIARDAIGTNLGTVGVALYVQFGGVANVTRASFVRARDGAVLSVGAGAQVLLEDALVEDTLPQACAATTCPAGAVPVGVGIGAYRGGALRATRFVVTRSAVLGAQVALAGGLDFDTGRIERCPIGVNVQVSGYDFDRLTRSVVLVDNDRNLDTTSLPTPEISLSF